MVCPLTGFITRTLVVRYQPDNRSNTHKQRVITECVTGSGRVVGDASWRKWYLSCDLKDG